MYGVLATCGLGCGVNCSATKIRRNRRGVFNAEARNRTPARASASRTAYGRGICASGARDL